MKMAPLFLSPGPNCEEQSGSGNTALHARGGWEGPRWRSYRNTTQDAGAVGPTETRGCGSSVRVPGAPVGLGAPFCPPLLDTPGLRTERGVLALRIPSNPFSFQPRLFPTSVWDAGCAAHGLVCIFGGFPAEFCKGKPAGGIRGSPQPSGEAPRSSRCACAIVPPPPFFFFYIYKRQKNKWKAKLAEVFKYFILVSNVNSYIVIAVLGVFRLHVTFVIFL